LFRLPSHARAQWLGGFSRLPLRGQYGLFTRFPNTW